MEEELRYRPAGEKVEQSPMEGSECDSNASEEFVERPSLKERVANIFHAVLGNGYDIFTKPHTATWIVLFISIAFYICFIFKTNSVLNSVRAGVILVCLFIIVFGANQFREGPIIRPHPVVWKVVLGVAIIYECIILFILSLPVDSGRQFMKFFDSSLGVPLTYRDYAADCRLYIPESPNHFKNLKDVLFDIFMLAHFLGWIWKAFVIRDWKILWALSIWFEALEISVQHILPNFQECWWDKMLADVFGCNLAGMCIGMWINRLLSAREYKWVDYTSIKTTSGRAKRFITQFTPESWKVYDWDSFGSFKSCAQTFFICVIFEFVEMNAFFLKSTLWVEPSHPVVIIRLIIWGFLSLPAMREAYDYFHDPDNKRLGQNFWTAICMMITEILIDIKYGEGILYGPNINPAPTAVKWAWIAFFGLIALYTVYYFIFGGSRIVYDDYKQGKTTWPILSRIIAWSVPLPMVYLIVWDIFFKPHIEFDSYHL